MVRELSPDKRAALLDAALKLFVANGVHSTSTAQIAQEAQVASGTLFLYFHTKRDLIHALILKIGQEQSLAVQALLHPDLSARDTFFAIWSGSIRWFMEHLDAYEYVRQVRDSGMISPEVSQESEKFFGYYFLAIQKGHTEGCIKPYPLEVIGTFLYHDLVAVMNLVKGLPDLARQKEFIQTGFEIFWDGIKK